MSELRRIGSFAKVRRGASPRPIGDPKYFGGEVGWVRIIDVTKYNYKYLRVTEQYLSLLGQSKSVAVGKGDLIMSICATVGKPIIVDMFACIHDGFVQLYDLIGVDTEYLFYQLQLHEKDFEKRGQPGTQINLNTKIVEDEKIWIPDEIGKQIKIAKIISTIDRTITHTEALIEKYQQIKAGLMHDLFTRGIGADGKLRPPRDEAPELYQESSIGWIPKEWKVKKLVELVHFQRGHDIVEAKFIEGDYPVISSGGVIGFHNEFTSKGPSVVIGRKGTIGKVHYVQSDFWAHDTSLYATNLFDNDPLFIYHLCNYLNLAKYGTRSGSPSLNRNDIHPLFVSKPLPTEQKSIVTRLNALSEKISSLSNECKKLRDLKSGLMHDLLTGKVQVNIDPV